MPTSLAPIAPAPIALFVYKRPATTRAVVESLLRNPLARQSKLYIFADGVKPSSIT